MTLLMLHLILRTYSQKMRGKQSRTCNLAHRAIQKTHIPFSAQITLLQCMPSYSTQTTSFRVVMHCSFINMSMSVPSDLCLQVHPSSVSSQSWQWSVALMTRQCKQGSVLYKWFSFLHFLPWVIISYCIQWVVLMGTNLYEKTCSLKKQ